MFESVDGSMFAARDTQLWANITFIEADEKVDC